MSERNTVSRTRKRYIPGRGTVYISERVPAPALPSLEDRPCLRIYDPVTRKEIPNLNEEIYDAKEAIEGLDIAYLYKRLKQIKEEEQTSDLRISVFDPCTKRKVGSIQELEARIKEIECYKFKTWGWIHRKQEGELNLQLHQELIVEGVQQGLVRNQYKDLKENRFLIGVLPRGGKTFIAGGLMRMMQGFSSKNKKNMIILWITAAPNETKMQVEKELLGNFTDFANYRFIAVRDARDVTITPGFTVLFVSSQLLTLAKLGVARERGFLSQLLNPTADGPKITMVFFDEAHKTGVGAATKTLVNDLLETNKTRTMPFILLTGTYARILEEYQIPRPHTFIWDYTDVLSARNLGHPEKHDEALETLKNRFGAYYVNHVIAKRRCSGESEIEMAKSYGDYPDLHFISGDFDARFIESMTSAGFYTKDTGLNMGKLLQLKGDATLADFKTRDNKIKKNGYTQFKNLELLESLFVPTLMVNTLKRIHDLSRQRGSRFRWDRNDSLMMFLPTGGKGTNIFFTLCAWASLLLHMINEVIPEKFEIEFAYEVACVVENETLPRGALGSDAQPNENVSSEGIHIVSKNVKETILRLKADAESRGKGLIVLAGEKMSMGVSLPFVDVVMMLNDKYSPDDIIQKMYRAVTPSAGKKDAFIVDFSPKRTLAAVYGYTKLSSHESLTPYQVFKILINTYYWDVDLVSNPSETLLYKDSFLSNISKLYQIVESEKEYGEGQPTYLMKRRMENLDQEILHLLGEFSGTPHPRPKLDLTYPLSFNKKTLEEIRILGANLKTKQNTLNAMLVNRNREDLNYDALRNATDNVDEARYRLANLIQAARIGLSAKGKTGTRKLTNEERAARTAEKARATAARAAAKAEALAAKQAAKEAEKARAAEAKEAAKAAAQAAKEAEKRRVANAKAAAKAERNATRAAARAAKLAARRTTTRKKPNTLHTGNTTENENA